jgi:hypothetical protein
VLTGILAGGAGGAIGGALSFKPGAVEPGAPGAGPSDETAEVASAPCHSFAAGTLVLLADGTRRAIDKIAVGEHVMAAEPTTGHTSREAVTAVHQHEDTDLVDIEVRVDGETRMTIHTTQHHRFWDVSLRRWVEAAALPAGDRLMGFDGGVVIISDVRPYAGWATMYDLTVADVHTYYVATGGEVVLVHNCGRPASTEIKGPTVRDVDATDQWDEFLGEGPYSDSHPRQGIPDADRIVSADGSRSIRMGSHETRNPQNFHYHEESWTQDADGQWNVLNRVRKVIR